MLKKLDRSFDMQLVCYQVIDYIPLLNGNLYSRAGELLLGLISQSPASSVYIDPITSATDSLQLARVLFDLKEYIKAASVLTEYAKPEFPQAYFLYHYSLYMVLYIIVRRIPKGRRKHGRNQL